MPDEEIIEWQEMLPTDTMTDKLLSRLKDLVNNLEFHEFCNTLYPQPPGYNYYADSYYVQKYRQFNTDFIGWLSYADSERVEKFVRMVNDYGNDG